LLAERDPKTNKKFSVEEIIGDMQDLLLAGHETTSNTVAFVLFLLSKFPSIQTQVQEESDKFSDSPSYDDASKMRLIDSVIKETLRLYPAAPLVARTAICDTEVDGIPTKKNSCIQFSIWSLGRDPALFREPEKFDPDRWNNYSDEKENDRGNNLSAWIPFGLGLRSCVGQRMAMMETKLVLCKLMQKYTARLDPSQAPELGLSLTIVLSPTDGVKLKMYSRQDQLIPDE